MNGFSSGFAALVAAHAGDAVALAMTRVSTEFLSQCSRLTAMVSPVRAEEHLIVALSAINSAVWDHGLKGAQFDALREALAEQMVQLADAVREADGADYRAAADTMERVSSGEEPTVSLDDVETQFGSLDEVQS